MSLNNWLKLVGKVEMLTNNKCVKCRLYKSSACMKTYGVIDYPANWDVNKNCCKYFVKR